MGSSYLISFITLSSLLFGVKSQTYQSPCGGYSPCPYQTYPQNYQSFQGYQSYPNYGLQSYPQYQQVYQQPYLQTYQQPYQQLYQQAYQQYPVPYGYSQYQPSNFAGRPNTYNYPYAYSSKQNSYPSVSDTKVNATDSNSTAKAEPATADPFANVKTEIIDVDPQYFNYVMRYHNLQPQVQTQSVQSAPRRYQYRPSYNITIGKNQHNYTSVPQIIKKHDVQHKTFSFKKTYVITPENRNQKINLNFVNGVPVTDTAEAYKEAVTESIPVTESEPIETTTEDENPVTKKSRRFIDVPSSCPEGSQLVEGVGCFKRFALAIDTPEEVTTTGSPDSN